LSRQQSDDDIVLYPTMAERRKGEKLAEFYAIIKTTEHLENARIKSAIERDEYARQCTELISQYKDAESALIDAGLIKSTREFVAEHRMDCPYAVERLVKFGVPATVLHRNVDERDEIGRARQAAEATQSFITAMDAIKLQQRAVDEVQPLVSDLMDRLNKVEGLPGNFEGIDKTRQWLITLNGMRAHNELTDDQASRCWLRSDCTARQLLHDLDTSYSAFFRFLEQTQKR
ncbi:unnamed protein product, partial [Phaeothamnion confervicola]